MSLPKAGGPPRRLELDIGSLRVTDAGSQKRHAARNDQDRMDSNATCARIRRAPNVAAYGREAVESGRCRASIETQHQSGRGATPLISTTL